jgi:hypothetical protein
MEITQLVQVVIGMLLLLGGKRLYYLFVGVLGFVLGLWAATTYSPFDSGPAILLLAVAAGFLGMLLAYSLQGLVIVLTGFAAGGLALLNLIRLGGWQIGSWEWLGFVGGGLLGIALMVWAFDWALIGLSALLGAGWIATALTVPPAQQPIVVALLAVVGMFAQWRQTEHHDPPALSELRRPPPTKSP